MPALRTAALATLMATGDGRPHKKVPRPREIEVFERYEAPPPEDANPDAPWHTQPLTRAEEVAIHEDAAEVTGRGSRMRVARVARRVLTVREQEGEPLLERAQSHETLRSLEGKMCA